MEKLIWKTEKRAVKDLIPWEGNPRQMSEKQVNDLKKSLRDFDLVEIPAVDVDGKIVSGHQRVKVLFLTGRGDEEIDVRVPNRKLTDQEFKRLNVTLNKVRGEFDDDLLASIEPDLLLDSGFDQKELDDIFDLDKEVGPEIEFGKELYEEQNYIVLAFDNVMDWQVAVEKFGLKTVRSMRDREGYEQRGLGRVVDGAEVLKMLK